MGDDVDPQSYVGRTVYSLDGFYRGTIVEVHVSKKFPGHITRVVVDLDEPITNRYDHEVTRKTWHWEDCKLA